MAITTHAELVTAIGNWTQRDDLATRSVEFIALAEAAFNAGFDAERPFRAFQQEANTTVACTEYTTVPTDFLELKGIKTTAAPIVKLQQITEEAGDTIYTSGSSGIPRYFTMEAGSIRVFPSPSAGTTLKITYAQKITPLASGSNWLIVAYPDIYLFGALLHGGVFAHDPQQLQTVISGYATAISGLRSVDRSIRYGGGALQTVAM